jgi:hypothetical protein
MTSLLNQQEFVQQLEAAFEQSNTDFARAYYLFATAKLKDTYESESIYAQYPILSDEETFHHIKAQYDANPDHEETKRLFTAVLGSYLGKKLAKESDELQNLKNQLTINVDGLNLKDKTGNPLTTLLYEDVPEYLKKLPDKATRRALYDRMAKAYTDNIAPRFIALFHQENQLFAELGYSDLVTFYSQTSGHDLQGLGQTGQQLIDATEDLYQEKMSAFFAQRVGEPFTLEHAHRSDISYVFHGNDPEMGAIQPLFKAENLYPLAQKTFDRLGLNYSELAKPVDFKTLDTYEKDVQEQPSHQGRILLDLANREGKRSRAYVYPAKVPSEIYLSVKPEGGLDDYSAFFHESGHALHFAYESPELSYAMALMGNNTVTEAYAYLFQNLFLNRHWLTHEAGLSAEQALKVFRRGALNDLYMLRRYASKMQFELSLYDSSSLKNTGLEGKPERYAELLTRGTGFTYDAEGWCRDVDAGFYVADYFTAWTLEAQLRTYLATHYGSPDVEKGEDWYLNPKAGEFLKSLWKDGNLSQCDLARRIGYSSPNEVEPLNTWMAFNLA